MNIPITRIDLIPSAAVDAGEVFCGSLDSPISNDGLKELKKAVRRKSGWEVVLTSPKERCTRFAEWLAQKHELPLQSDKAFCEMDFGEWEGLFPHQVLENAEDQLLLWWSDPALAKPPKGEAFGAFHKRVLRGWQQLLKQHKGKNVLLITHPGVLRVILSEVLGMPSQNFFALHVEHGTLSSVQVTHDEGGHWSNLVSYGC